MCLRGASALETLLRGDTARLAVLVVWEHVTPSDHGLAFPGTHVLARVADPRAEQFWDEERLLSQVMVRELPPDTLPSVAQMNSTVPIAWDCVALYRPGIAWTGRVPVPDWAARPVADVLGPLREHLDALERPAAAPRR